MDDTKVGADQKNDPAEVAKQGFEALMADKDDIIDHRRFAQNEASGYCEQGLT